jgi:hypothetical protein
MAGITKTPQFELKIKHLTDHVFSDLCKKYKSPELHAGFEIFRNAVIFEMKHECLNFSNVK